jgi:YhcG PDDEXK nuclease domain
MSQLNGSPQQSRATINLRLSPVRKLARELADDGRMRTWRVASSCGSGVELCRCRALLDNLQQFLLELGRGFAFVARQFRISTESKDFYIDLVFYNYLLKCFVLFDLKSGELTHQDIGQMDMYVRMTDELKRAPDDNPTVGIILCTGKDASWCAIPSSTRTSKSSPAGTSSFSLPKRN